ncbi:MAG: hypothetical protein EXR91_08060 [Gemmatimonadetes bacterium]|nr:hypothetical protein [Gemmatimonadota bacterium]
MFRIAAVRALADHLVPLVNTEWIGECYTSFHLMRAGSVRRAFTFDPHFSEKGFAPVSSP